MSTVSEEPLESRVGRLLTAQKQTLAIAESCTGGLITHRLTNIPGSSEYFIGAVVAYAYLAKVAALGLEWDALDRFGSVSEETAMAMARGVRAKFTTTIGLAVTGIAGPGGASPDKPVGLTYIAMVSGDDERIERHVWAGDRVQNKESSAEAALSLLEKHLNLRTEPR